MLDGLRAGLERSWIGGATFAQECKAASPCPSAATVANSFIGFLVAEHAGVLIVKIDLTWIRPFPKPSRSESTRLDQRH